MDVSQFLSLVNRHHSDGIPDWESLSCNGDFLPTWKNLLVWKHLASTDDFQVVLVGAEVVVSCVGDFTGKLLSDGVFEKPIQTIYETNHHILTTYSRVYDDGNLMIKERPWKYWHEVKMPLRRKGQISEILVFKTFSCSRISPR